MELIQKIKSFTEATKSSCSYCFSKKQQYFYHVLVINVSENLTQIPSNKYRNLPILQKKNF